jgi:two-component system secretion response regulator SsrB
MRIALAEDQALMREMLRKVLTEVLNHRVVAEAETGPACVSEVFQSRPDILILDLALPGYDGLAVLDQIKDFVAVPRVIILTAFCNIHSICRARYPFVRAFVDKGSCRIEVLKTAIDTVSSGGLFFSEFYKSLRYGAASLVDAKAKILSPREVDVLVLMGDLNADWEIAAKLSISEETVEKHRSNIQRKIGTTSRMDLVRWAQHNGYMNNAVR